MSPKGTKEVPGRSSGSASRAPDRPGSTGPREPAEETDRIVAGFLANRPEVVVQVAGWAKSVVQYRLWAFESPEDIVQETLLALVQNLREERFKGGDLRAYVRRIAKNICISSYRRLRTRGTHLPVCEEISVPSSRDAGPEIERQAMLQRILERLDEACRQLITLAYAYGIGRKEIAQRLGISETAAKVRLHRCLEKARTTQR